MRLGGADVRGCEAADYLCKASACEGQKLLWQSLIMSIPWHEWYITSNLLPGMSFILLCDSDYVRTCRLCKILIHQLNSAIEVDFDIVFTFSLTHSRTVSAVYKVCVGRTWNVISSSLRPPT